MEPKLKPWNTKIISIVAKHINCELYNYEIDPATNN